MRREGRLNGGAILQISLDQLKGGASAGGGGFELLQPRPLQGWVVVGIDVVEAHHRRTCLHQPPAEEEADKAGGTGDKDAHAGGGVERITKHRPQGASTFQN